MFVLETIGLTKKYKEQYAVKGVNMHIHEGDIYGFVGENGAGKTTIIRLITGLAAPTEGEYTLFGVKNKEKEIYKAREKVAGIVETVSINRSMNALNNLKLQCYLTGAKKTDKELIELLKSVGLNPNALKKKKAGHYSLGMRQRLGLAIAMVSGPKFIILDEPMNGLDPKGFIAIREAVVNLNKLGVTFLISSHILAELDKICTRIGFISHGTLLEEISIEDLRDKERKKVFVECDNIDEVTDKLKEKFSLVDYKIEGTKLYIYDEIDINDLIAYVVKNKIHVTNIGGLQDTIEDYYMSLMRGR